MIDLIAIRDNETGDTVELRELTDAEVADNGAELMAAKRQQYPPPQYELVHGAAPSLEAFTRNYPRFQAATPPDDAAPTEDAAPPARAAGGER